jgi:hypothetical protein
MVNFGDVLSLGWVVEGLGRYKTMTGGCSLWMTSGFLLLVETYSESHGKS